MVSSNQRREARAVVAIPIVLVRGKTELRLETLDVSFRGVFVRVPTSSRAALRSLVRLRVELPTGGFEAHAMVVHVGVRSEVEGMGLQFWGLSGNERRAWETFVSRVHGAQRSTGGRELQPTPTPGNDLSPSGIRAISVQTPATPTAVPSALVGVLKGLGRRS